LSEDCRKTKLNLRVKVERFTEDRTEAVNRMTRLLLLSALLSVIVSVNNAFPHPSGSLDKRGFRLGAGDRFSHGFGKRLSPDDVDDTYTVDAEEAKVRSSDLADQLVRNPGLLQAFLQRYFDGNNDGFITRNELLSMRDD